MAKNKLDSFGDFGAWTRQKPSAFGLKYREQLQTNANCGKGSIDASILGALHRKGLRLFR